MMACAGEIPALDNFQSRASGSQILLGSESFVLETGDAHFLFSAEAWSRFSAGANGTIVEGMDCFQLWLLS